MKKRKYILLGLLSLIVLGTAVFAGDIEMKINGAADAVTIDKADGSEAMRITADGKVGIGTTTPTKKLDIYGDVAIGTSRSIQMHNSKSNSLGAGPRELFRISSTALSTGGVFSIAATRANFVHNSTWSWSSNHHSLGRGMLTQLSGSAYSNIHVYLDVSSGGSVIVSADWGAAQDYQISIQAMLGAKNLSISEAGTDWTVPNTGYTRVEDVTTAPYTFQTNKGIFRGTVLALAHTTTSDRRLKTNLTPIATALDKIVQLNGVEFDWNELSKREGEHDVGVIAQDVEAVFPQFVTTGSDGYKSVDYAKLTAPLIEAVKELAQKVEQKDRQIEKLIKLHCEEKPESSVCHNHQ